MKVTSAIIRMSPGGALYPRRCEIHATKAEAKTRLRQLTSELRDHPSDEETVVLLAGWVDDRTRIGTWNPGHRAEFYPGILA